MKKNNLIIFSLVFFVFVSFLKSGQFENQSLSLKISPLSINFPPADPDHVPIIPAQEQILVEINISGNEGKNWQLTVLADGDLRAPGGGKIPIENISWTASPSPPFINGILNKRTPQLVANGQGNVILNGQLNFFLQNSWDYRSGDYTQIIVFILASF